MKPSPAAAFRIATIADIPLLQGLASRIWREHYPGIITHAQIDYMLGTMYAPEVMRDEIDNQGYCYVIVLHDGEPAGFIAYVHEPVKKAVKVSKLYLLPALHGKGIGSQMLGYVKNDALRTGSKTVYLFVNKGNAKAIRSYERFGFRKVEELVTDIGKGFVMDDFRMELLL